MNEADPNPEPPHLLLDEDPLLVDNGNGNNSNDTGDIDEDMDDEDDGAVASPTVEAYVELAKTSCKFVLFNVDKMC